RRVVESGRRREGLARLHEALGREAAVGHRGPAEHPVADGHVGHALTDLEHVTADLQPRDEGRLRPHLVLAAAHEGVGEVHRARAHHHPHLPGAGPGGGGLAEGEDLRRGAELLGLPRADAHDGRGYPSDGCAIIVSMTRHARIPTDIGELTAVLDEASGRGTVLVGLYFPGHWTLPDPRTFGPPTDGAEPVLEALADQLGEY